MSKIPFLDSVSDLVRQARDHLIFIDRVEFGMSTAESDKLLQLPLIEIIYIESGIGLLRTDNKTLIVSAGELYAFSVQKPHALTSLVCKALTARRLFFDPAVIFPSLEGEDAFHGDLSDILRQNQMVHLTLSVQQQKSVSNKYDELLMETSQKPFGWRLAVRSQMILLLLMLKRFYEDSRNLKIDSERKAASLASEVINLIHKYYSDPSFSLKVVSDILFQTPSSISRVFAEITGTFFSDYLRTYRMKKALILLKETSQSVEEIALLCGYRDVSTFYKQFQRIIGVTPGAFRKQFQTSAEPDVYKQLPDA